MKSKLHLIPTPLGGENPRDVLPAPLFEVIGSLKLFFVEELRTARRFLSKAGLKGEIDKLTLYELNEHTSREQIECYVKYLTEQEGALISEAGLPAVADPGALLVEFAHQHDIEVIPYVGPSSLMMA
ncbi:MAG TPA: SAM-dependent methyltransferase, partial [Bacteroidales bacterium]|nr:SAM-dependent methyltransferase [Bacteroidales bacterium]